MVDSLGKAIMLIMVQNLIMMNLEPCVIEKELFLHYPLSSGGNERRHTVQYHARRSRPHVLYVIKFTMLHLPTFAE